MDIMEFLAILVIYFLMNLQQIDCNLHKDTNEFRY